MVMLFLGIGIVAAVGLWCVSKDLGWALQVARLVKATTAAVVLSVAVYLLVSGLGCDSMDKYSFGWYAGLCFLGEHSS